MLTSNSVILASVLKGLCFVYYINNHTMYPMDDLLTDESRKRDSLSWGTQVSPKPGFPWQFIELSRSQKMGLVLGRVSQPAVPWGPILHSLRCPRHLVHLSSILSLLGHQDLHLFPTWTQSHIAQPVGSNCALFACLGNATLHPPHSPTLPRHHPWCS